MRRYLSHHLLISVVRLHSYGPYLLTAVVFVILNSTITIHRGSPVGRILGVLLWLGVVLLLVGKLLVSLL